MHSCHNGRCPCPHNEGLGLGVPDKELYDISAQKSANFRPSAALAALQVGIRDHEGPLKSSFPIENRLVPQGARLPAHLPLALSVPSFFGPNLLGEYDPHQALIPVVLLVPTLLVRVKEEWVLCQAPGPIVLPPIVWSGPM